MLAFCYVTLRFIHFSALMVLFGNALYSAWLAPVSLRRLLKRRFRRRQQTLALISLLSALIMLALQGGMMGSGWQDVISPPTWQAVLATQFGRVWLWQMMLAFVTLWIAWLEPRKAAPLLLLFTAAQFILLAGTGHAAMHDGILGRVQRSNHALHLLCTAVWLGGLLPLLFCLRLSHGRWREAAIHTMMRSSGCSRGLAHRGDQYLVDPGLGRAVALGLGANAVVEMCAGGNDGGNCPGESVCSGAAISFWRRTRATLFYQDDAD